MTHPARVTSVAVLGGGISGLAAAWHLSQRLPRNIPITLFEAQPRTGGWMKSIRVERPGGSILFETGPHSIRPKSVAGLATIELLQQLGATNQAIFTNKDDPTAMERYIKYRNQLVPIQPPKGVIRKIRFLLDARHILGSILAGMAKMALWPRWGSKGLDDESIGSFMRRMTNDKFTNVLLSAMVHGVYAGDVDRLSMRSTLFKPLWNMYLKRKFSLNPPVTDDEATLAHELKENIDPEVVKTALDSVMYTFPDGTETLPRLLLEKLQMSERVTIKTDNPVQQIIPGKQGEIKIRSALQSQIYSHVISTIPLPTLFLLTKVPPDLTARFPRPVTVAVINLCYPPNAMTMPIKGFGYLIPKTEENAEDALGVIFAFKSAQDQDTGLYARGTKLTVMMGGHYWRGRTSFPSDDELLAAAKAVVGRDLGVTAKPAASCVSLQRDCIPQYEVGHWKRVEELNGYLDGTFGKDRLLVVGSAVDGVGVGDCVLSARKAAMRLSELC